MLVQIVTVDRSKRPAAELDALRETLVAAGHTVLVRRSAAAPSYRGRSGHDQAVVEAIWEAHRGCLAYARSCGAGPTLVLEDDCEFSDVGGIVTAERFIAGRDDVDLFFLGASPNSWWTRTADAAIVRFTHVYWWHAIVFTERFIRRFADTPRTWRKPNDLHFSRLVAQGDLSAFGLRRQVAFQRDRRNRFAETTLYGFPWGDGRRVALTAAAGAGALWWAVR